MADSKFKKADSELAAGGFWQNFGQLYNLNNPLAWFTPAFYDKNTWAANTTSLN